MEDEDKLDQNLKDQNGDQNHDDDNQDDQDRDDQDQNDNDDQNNDDGDGEDTIESLKEKLAKATKAYNDQKIRAEKAEKRFSEDGKNNNKKVEPQKKISKSDDLSPKDLYALMEKKVPKEDVDDVVQYAKFSKISVESALESDFVTRLLADKAEKRATARATNTGSSRRGAGKPSGQSLLNNAISKGEIPDDDAELDALIDARLEQKKKQNSNKR